MKSLILNIDFGALKNFVHSTQPPVYKLG